MAVRSGFFNSINGDRIYSATHWAEYFATFIGNGVFPNPSSNLQIASNNNMTISVKAGKGWINGYILINDSDYLLDITPADGALNRIDRIVMRYDTVDREIRLEVKQGTFATNPTAPVLQRDADAFELALADIRVNAGAISISQANITDTRLNGDLCGIVHGVVDQVDTKTLFNQYQSWIAQEKLRFENDVDGWMTNEQDDFETWEQQQKNDFDMWFANIQDILGGNVAGNLQNQITQLQADLGNIDAPSTQEFESLQTDFSAHRAETATQDEYGHIKLSDIPKEKGMIGTKEVDETGLGHKAQLVYSETEGQWITKTPLPDDNTGSPGPKYLMAGDMTAGYFGVVSASELYTGEEISAAVGITEGTIQFNDVGWLKFVIDGDIIFKSQKTYRHSISWNHIDSKGAVKGTKQVSKGGINYKVTLMKGTLTDPSVDASYGEKGAKGSEWNRLMLPIHVQAKDKSWEWPTYVEPDIPYWGIDFTDADLHTKQSGGLGLRHWCQESLTSVPADRVIRGVSGVSYIANATASSTSNIYGWSPVLRVVR